MLRFGILGPLEICAGDRIVRPRGPLQSALLLTLLINARRLVLTDGLIGELWPERVPVRVENALQAHVSRLRHTLAALEPERDQPRVVTHPAGYQLLVDDQDLDSTVFAGELDRIRPVAETDPVGAVTDLRAILGLWRGPVLGGAVGGVLCKVAAVRYSELYLAALELLFDSELDTGNHVRVIPELGELLTQYPYQERFWQQLMIALYRSGRQAAALDVYRGLVRRLDAELGLKPTPEMRKYEQAILDQDPMLDLPAALRSAGAPLSHLSVAPTWARS